VTAVSLGGGDGETISSERLGSSAAEAAAALNSVG
jgi:hypothetical protein